MQAARDAKDMERVRTVLSAQEIVHDNWLREQAPPRRTVEEEFVKAQLTTYRHDRASGIPSKVIKRCQVGGPGQPSA